MRIESSKGFKNAKSTHNKTGPAPFGHQQVVVAPFFFVDSRGRTLAGVEPRSTRLSNRSQDRCATEETLEATPQTVVTNISPPF